MGGTLSANSDDGEERTVEAVVSEEGSTSDMFTALKKVKVCASKTSCRQTDYTVLSHVRVRCMCTVLRTI